ncbi:MAG: RNA polymerase sigma factor [Planctomycetota bacterium]
MQQTFDDTWHRAALAGDAEAIDRLARGALQPLYRFCLYRVGRNRHLCEEVVQETLVRAIRQLDRYEPARADGDIFAWLTGLARNEIRRALAHEKATTSLEILWAKMDQELRDVYARLESKPLGDAVIRREETRQMVGATMSQLPANYREALEAKYLSGRSVRDMAADWSLSEKAVESRLTRARKAFRATFVALARNLSLEAST